MGVLKAGRSLTRIPDTALEGIEDPGEFNGGESLPV